MPENAAGLVESRTTDRTTSPQSNRRLRRLRAEYVDRLGAINVASAEVVQALVDIDGKLAARVVNEPPRTDNICRR